ncbi:hypothetical protein [Sphingomonas sp. Marseille-Q8236]
MPSQILWSLPYLEHTDRESGLMLKGVKPPAMFVDGRDCFPAGVIRYLRLFDRRVAAGRIIRRDMVTEASAYQNHAVHRMLLVLLGQEWRIDAMIALKGSPEWTPDHERREGQLLGYEDWMNDHWHDLIARHGRADS